MDFYTGRIIHNFLKNVSKKWLIQKPGFNMMVISLPGALHHSLGLFAAIALLKTKP